MHQSTILFNYESHKTVVFRYSDILFDDILESRLILFDNKVCQVAIINFIVDLNK